MPHPRVQFVLFDGFDPLDVIAPCEVLTAGSDVLGGALDIGFVSAEGPRDVVSGVPGITLAATAALDPTAPGYVVVPGAAGPVDGDPDEIDTIPVLLSRFAAGPAAPLLRACLDHTAVTVATVCGGSLALAMAGLLEGRTATTHVLGVDLLEAAGVTAVRARVVDDGDLVTAGGVTSGLDLGLHLLERDFGPRIAHAVEELFEYERRGTAWRDTGLVAAEGAA
ncbi:DJ-1/PfpI family protein [Pseudonocardia sp. ICBG162]|uniref:DJ-1/PfpI family protein n=1 Tax=Pseudonocardia sp. ICBG162 TaxID=2846761 RepID=UPI001CF69B66|nr:DJ-1/PfpI family protein [Pseudonocardia sp. ICBG162]